MHYDIAIFGTGYAGFAAALAAAKDGKSVFFFSDSCALLWESSLARHPIVGLPPPEMSSFLRALSCATGIAADWIDPGSAEWVANEILLDSNISRLYFAAPVSAECSPDGLLASVTLSLRDHLESVSASQWIDASENASLSRLLSPSLPTRTPSRCITRLFFQSTSWTLDLPRLSSASLHHSSIEDSCWSSEKILHIEHAPSSDLFVSRFSPIINALTEFSPLRNSLSKPVLFSHWSYCPYPLYSSSNSTPPLPKNLPANLAIASPSLSCGSFDSLSDRFSLGLQAYASLSSAPKLPTATIPTPKITPPIPTSSLSAAISIAGLGSGGLPAAIAAARSLASSPNSTVVAFDSQPIPGGVATHGGIHSYYWGCPGGLQSEIDQTVADISPLIASPEQYAPTFHPLARELASIQLLHNANVTPLFNATLIPSSVSVNSSSIHSLLLYTPSGITEIKSSMWIDSTGEGFLARFAGATRGESGRIGDGSFHAYTQSWGAFGYFSDGLKTFITNPDSGFVDPLSSADMTHARIHGIHSLVFSTTVHSSNSFNRTTGVMPSIGIRQGHLIKTQYQLSMDDMVERRTFHDSIGFTGGHIDNHSVDYFAESKDLAFFNWACHAWSFTTACEIPYRALLPLNLNNLWIACRAAGCTEEASNAFRMQRDMQRIGEAAGIAAALAFLTHTPSYAIPLDKLQSALNLSGALAPLSNQFLRFGRGLTQFEGDPLLTAPISPESISKWTDLLLSDSPNGNIALWRLYRSFSLSKSLPDNSLSLSPSLSPIAFLRIAFLRGALGDPSAEPALISIIEKRESLPEGGHRIPPFTTAAWILAFCGSPLAFPCLASLAADLSLPSIPRLTALWSMADIASRHTPLSQTSLSFVEIALANSTDITDSLRPWERAFVSERLRAHASLPSNPSDHSTLATSPWLLVRSSLSLLS